MVSPVNKNPRFKAAKIQWLYIVIIILCVIVCFKVARPDLRLNPISSVFEKGANTHGFDVEFEPELAFLSLGTDLDEIRPVLERSGYYGYSMANMIGAANFYAVAEGEATMAEYEIAAKALRDPDANVVIKGAQNTYRFNKTVSRFPFCRRHNLTMIFDDDKTLSHVSAQVTRTQKPCGFLNAF